MMGKKFRYIWKPPVLVLGQQAEFLDHRGSRRLGVCRHIETHYNHDGVAWHTYAMHPEGRRRWVWVGGKNILMEGDGREGQG